MVTVSHLVKKIVNERPVLQETMIEGIISYGALAEKIKPYIERELGKRVKEPAIVMALRRYSDEIAKKSSKKIKFDFRSEMLMKTGIMDITVLKSPQLFRELEKLYRLVDYEKGDTLNIVHGSYEVSIITNEKYREKILGILKNEKVVNKESRLVLLSMKLPKDFLYTPGIVAAVTRRLAWENINLYEIVTTNTEFTFVLNQKDATRAYNALQELISN